MTSSPQRARAMVRRARGYALVLVAIAACGDDDASAIQTVVIEAPPGLPQRLDRIDVTVSLVVADGEVAVRTVSAEARYGAMGLLPWVRDFRPQSSSHPGRQLYRFRAAGIVAGVEVVAAQHSLVFVPGTRVVLPLRLRAECVDARCGREETCVEGGMCEDDAIQPCSLLEPPLPAFCDDMDAGRTDAGSRDAAASTDAPADAGSLDSSTGCEGCAWGCVSGVCDDPVELASGDYHTCARRESGTVVCWGLGTSGQLGDGTSTNRATPVAVRGLVDAVEIVGGGEYTCARRASGGVVCWGRNDANQLGDTTRIDRPEPVVVSNLTDARGLAAGQFHACAWRVGGTATCWGVNDFGQLGDGTTNDRDRPTSVGGVASVAEITAAWGHTCARLGASLVNCWGANDVGQLGDGTMAPRSAPVVVSGLADAVELSSSESRTCARRASGAIVCWGDNVYGQLGDGTAVDRPSPVPVVGIADAVEVSVGGTHTCARRASGAVLCWGDNDRGDLGDGTTDASLAPVAVVGLTDAVELAAGSFHSCARRANGRVVCWGDDGEGGTLGDGAMHPLCMPIGRSCSTTPVEVVAP